HPQQLGYSLGRQGPCLCERGLYQRRLLQRELRRHDLRRALDGPLSGWNLPELVRVAALLGAILSLHAGGAVAAGTGKAQLKVNVMHSLTEADNERSVDLRVGESVRLT